MKKFSAFLTVSFISASLPVSAHDTADNELAHAELPELYYDFCEAYERDIARYTQSLETAETPDEIEYYAESIKVSHDEIERLRQELADHGYNYGSCGVSL